jgi:glycosyltransferase involved in cell wall biosynthesis
MKVAILGSRGIPNHHGGFEQFAEYFAVFLADHNVDVTVYNSSLHPYKEKSYKGVQIVSCKDPEDKYGTAGQFIYDLNCILDARKKNFDIILQLGYTSSSIWHFLMPKQSLIVSNMDGLEWKRSKYGNLTKKFLKYAERLAAKYSDFLISDSIGIQNYLNKAYNKKSKFIAYGAHLFNKPNADVLKQYKLTPNTYNLLIARLEPENNIEEIIEGAKDFKYPLVVIGDFNRTKLGQRLHERFKTHNNIFFLGAIYNTNHLDNLRYYSYVYFHGHSVGGTNPSLLEAMASNAFIIANENEFNKSVLGKNALYFKEVNDIKHHLESIDQTNYQQTIDANRRKIQDKYSWDTINNAYLSYFEELLTKK